MLFLTLIPSKQNLEAKPKTKKKFEKLTLLKQTFKIEFEKKVDRKLGNKR